MTLLCGLGHLLGLQSAVFRNCFQKIDHRHRVGHGLHSGLHHGLGHGVGHGLSYGLHGQIQWTLFSQVVETSVNVTSNSPSAKGYWL